MPPPANHVESQVDKAARQVATAAVEESQVGKAARQAAGEFVRGVSAARGFIGDYPAEAGRYHLYIAFNCPWCHRVALAREMLGLVDVISMDVALPTRSEEDHPQGEGKWMFAPDGIVGRNGATVKFDECTADTVNGLGTAVEIYRAFGRDDKERAERSLPMLFDKRTECIVNNESSEIVRMLGTAFGAFSSAMTGVAPAVPSRKTLKKPPSPTYHRLTHVSPLRHAGMGGTPTPSLYPDVLRPAIDEMNAFV